MIQGMHRRPTSQESQKIMGNNDIYQTKKLAGHETLIRLCLKTQSFEVEGIF